MGITTINIDSTHSSAGCRYSAALPLYYSAHTGTVQEPNIVAVFGPKTSDSCGPFTASQLQSNYPVFVAMVLFETVASLGGGLFFFGGGGLQ